MIRKLVFILVVSTLAASTGLAGVAPLNLEIGACFKDPIGFHSSKPTFSWQLPAEGPARSQTAYRIVAASEKQMLPEQADLWDSGKVNSDQSVWVPYEGKELSSRQRVYWQVKIWDQDGHESDWSSTATLEIALLRNKDWKGKWIRKGESSPDSASDDKMSIVIQKAVYGIPDNSEQQIDLSEKIKQRVASGNYTVQADNEFAGGDPIYGTKKKLLLKYILNGEEKGMLVDEGRKISLLTGEELDAGGRYVPQYLRREFMLKAGQIERARLHVSAKGLYQVYINGEKVGNDYMAPGWTPYKDRIETLTYDVASHLKDGHNAIGAILGEGWYAGRMMGKKFVYPAAQPILLAQLEIVYENGERELIVTDNSWKATDEGPIRFSGIYDGEIYDARMQMPGWSKVGFDDSNWAGVEAETVEPEPKLKPKRHFAVRATEKLPTVTITEPEPGRYVFDLGQNMVGWPRLNIPVEKDRTVTVRFAEMLKKDGTLYTDNYRSAKSTNFYTPARNGTVSWHPIFTFHGFRYVELSGLPEGVQPEKDWVDGVVLHSDFPSAGSFTSSSPMLNRLQSNIRWGQRGNFLDIPTDCPQRDERLGWTGDAQVFCATSLFNFNTHAFWASWLESMRAEQRSDGQIPHVVPDTIGGVGSPGWADASVTIPWDVYIATGDRRVLRNNYDMMREWVGFYERKAQDYIVQQGGYGDWLQPQSKRGGSRGDTPNDLIATAYFGHCTGILHKTATILGKPQDVARYARQFENIRAAFSAKYFDENAKLTVKVPTQTGYLMALGFDLLEPGLRPGAIKNLLALIEEANGHLRTGFLGTPLLPFVLDETGHADIAYQVLFKETYPSWFFSINQGATTMWERWNSYSHADGFGNAGMNSFNHYAYGAVGEWMYQRIAGLAPDPAHPGYKHFFIQPLPGGPLTHASAVKDTDYGKAASGWKQTEDGWIVEATVPPNTTATFVPPQPDGIKPTVTESGRDCALERRNGLFVYDIGPGSYSFRVATEI